MQSARPLLTIAIPTYMRAEYLKKNLAQLNRIGHGLWDEVELLISDNASTDATEQYVQNAISNGLPVRYIKNPVNIGGDPNFAQCFNMAQGKYFLLLGDDDFFVDGALSALLMRLRGNDYGVVHLRTFGFEQDFQTELPAYKDKDIIYDDAGKFLENVAHLMTLISGCVVNKELISPLDARDFIGGNLIQVHWVIRAVLAAKQNLQIREYFIGCKRNNSGGYDFSEVFVVNFLKFLDQYKSMGVSDKTIGRIEKRLLLGYYPQAILRQRLGGDKNIAAALKVFDARFREQPLYFYFVRPILSTPRFFGIAWGMGATFIGRSLSGDFLRGIYFLAHKMKRKFFSA